VLRRSFRRPKTQKSPESFVLGAELDGLFPSRRQCGTKIFLVRLAIARHQSVSLVS